MGWAHCHRRLGAWLAFAALAVQLVLSFGHVHLYVTGATDAALTAPPGTTIARASQQQPAQNPDDDDDYCAICASIFLVSTSFVSTPPPLPVADGFERITHSININRSLTALRRAAFRSRAPPPSDFS
jgi:hypothetical protein